MDPKLDQRVASFYDNQIMIWDTRSFDKPIVTQEQLLKVTKIEWCRSRQGLLGSAAENSTNLTIHDIQAWSHTGIFCLHLYETTCVSLISAFFSRHWRSRRDGAPRQGLDIPLSGHGRPGRRGGCGFVRPIRLSG